MARIAPVEGLRATTEPRRPARASQAACCTWGLMVSSIAPPFWVSPVMSDLMRLENREGSWPLSTEFSARSSPVIEAKAVEK